MYEDICTRLANSLEHKTDNFKERTLRRLEKGTFEKVENGVYETDGCLDGDEYSRYEIDLHANHLDLCTCYHHKGGSYRARSVCTHVGAVAVEVASRISEEAIEGYASRLNESVKSYRRYQSRVEGMVDTLGIEEQYSKTRAEIAEREGNRTVQLDDETWVVRGGKHNGHRVKLSSNGYESEHNDCAEKRVPAGCELGAMISDAMDVEPVETVEEIDAGRIYTVEGVCVGTYSVSSGPEKKGYFELNDGNILSLAVWDDSVIEEDTRYRIKNTQILEYNNTLQMNINESCKVISVADVETGAEVVELTDDGMRVSTSILTDKDEQVFDTFLTVEGGYLYFDHRADFSRNQLVYRSDIIDEYSEQYDFVTGEQDELLRKAFEQSGGEIYRTGFEEADEYDKVTVIGDVTEFVQRESRGPEATATIDSVDSGDVTVKFWVDTDISEGDRIAVVGGTVGFFRDNKELNVNEDTVVVR